MSRRFYHDLAGQGLAMPIGTDLILHERRHPEAVRVDGEQLGSVVSESARCWETPLAIPLMDLRLEKRDLLDVFGVSEPERDQFHFREMPDESAAREAGAAGRPFPRGSFAQQEAIRYVREQRGLVPVGMTIGPLSLATKLMDDPIPAIALAAAGVSGQEEPLIALFERCLALAERAVSRSMRAQLDAGAVAMLVCEPAASTAYLSPRRLSGEGDALDRFVLGPHQRLKNLVEDAGADYLFHDCGELTARMLRRIAHEIHPTVLSLGSSRKLWEDAAVVPPDVVLFGNLPTRQFYSDLAMPLHRVETITRELRTKMALTGHPYILGSECDVLHVEGASGTIRRKVEWMLEVARNVSRAPVAGAAMQTLSG